jgi:hypothetical protein
MICLWLFLSGLCFGIAIGRVWMRREMAHVKKSYGGQLPAGTVCGDFGPQAAKPEVLSATKGTISFPGHEALDQGGEGWWWPK